MACAISVKRRGETTGSMSFNERFENQERLSHEGQDTCEENFNAACVRIAVRGPGLTCVASSSGGDRLVARPMIYAAPRAVVNPTQRLASCNKFRSVFRQYRY